MVYPAHIRKAEDGTEEVQTVPEHLRGTAERAAHFAKAFGAEKEAYFTGILHDAGKFSDAFVERISHNGKRCDHSTAGTQEAIKRGNLCAAFAIAGHHGGLPDGGGASDCPGDATLFGRRGKAIPSYTAFYREMEIPQGKFPAWLGSGPGELRVFQTAFFTRMLFSCLVDADFLDTETFMAGGTAQREEGVPLEELLPRFDRYLHEHHWDTPRRDLDRLRWDILSKCRQAGRLSPGLFTLTVPTGGGKTGASLGFALEHALANHFKRIIYVIPYCNIIEQNAQVFRDMLGADSVLEHHSGVDYDPANDDPDPDSDRKRLATENWDGMPVVVTTAVQFFESLFAAKPSRCRKLHNLAQSVLIFDEAQMLPVPYLRPCLAALAQLLAHYNCSVVLCTATQPALGGLLADYGITARELCPEAQMWAPRFKRVAFRQEGDWSDEELLQHLRKERQALCIVNSRRQAQALYQGLETEGRCQLSTLMTAADRHRLLREIRSRLLQGLPCRVVATSLVEAGVDLDFPAVYRAEAGLDSILQAAGRCNREGKHPARESIVHIFRSAAPALFAPNIAAAREALRQVGEPDDPDAVRIYFEALYCWKGEGLDQKHIMDQWQRGSQGVQYPFTTIARQFHLIEQQTTAVYIPTEENKVLIQHLKSGFVSRRLYRQLGQWTVSVYPQHLKALEDGGHLDWVDAQTPILRTPELYSRETGLAMDPAPAPAPIW